MTETGKSEGDKQLMTVIAYDRYDKAEQDAKRNLRAIITYFIPMAPNILAMVNIYTQRDFICSYSTQTSRKNTVYRT